MNSTVKELEKKDDPIGGGKVISDYNVTGRPQLGEPPHLQRKKLQGGGKENRKIWLRGKGKSAGGEKRKPGGTRRTLAQSPNFRVRGGLLPP